MIVESRRVRVGQYQKGIGLGRAPPPSLAARTTGFAARLDGATGAARWAAPLGMGAYFYAHGAAIVDGDLVAGTLGDTDNKSVTAAIVLHLAASTGHARSSVALRGDSRNKGNGVVVAGGGGAVFVGGEYAGDAAFGSPPLRSGRPRARTATSRASV